MWTAMVSCELLLHFSWLINYRTVEEIFHPFYFIIKFFSLPNACQTKTRQMKKFLLIYLYGAITIFEGIFLLFSENITFNIIVLTTGITLTFGAILAFIAAFSRKRNRFNLPTMKCMPWLWWYMGSRPWHSVIHSKS